MTVDEFVAGIFDREGEVYGDRDTVPPIDQPTGAGGITLPALRAYVEATGAPLAPTVATLRALTRATATPIVRWQVETDLAHSGIGAIAYEPLRWQLLDFAYNSGPPRAIRWLQRVLRIPRTGRMDLLTVAAVNAQDPFLVNQALVAARLEMIDRWTDEDKRAKAWEEGLESRGLRFSQLEVP